MTDSFRGGNTMAKRQVMAWDVRPSDWAVGFVQPYDAADCWQTRLLAGDSHDPIAWTEAVTARPPKWVDALMTLRNGIVRPFGLITNSKSSPDDRGFPVLGRREREAISGVSDSHLDFWVVTSIDDDMVRVATYVRLKNTFGKLYWSVVQFFHPLVVKAAMARAVVPSAQDGLDHHEYDE
ncbi:MAG: DUF2867 domain-containing protein [Propionibacteriaceae bacterium]|nr:DUF2867 domain-containing protein [Propionibacteriaceae bacterium]